jgi:uncharacterized protein YecE (DUF72 family)
VVLTVGELRIGTSGWQYRDWRPSFYPPGLAPARWLEHYAARFDTVEINSSFYRLPREEGVRRWAASTPPGFRFAIKASRFLTHVKRLRDPEAPVQLLLSRVRALDDKRGPVLVQLPPGFPRALDRLGATLAAFGDDVRVAVEFRDPTWHDDAVYQVLHEHGAALVWWDRRGSRGPLVRTAEWLYLRLHEGRAQHSPAYGRRALTTWCERIAESFGDQASGFVFFNNDHAAAAPRNAIELRHLAAGVGLEVSAAGPAAPDAAPGG